MQLKALRAALEGAEGPERRETLARLGREYGVRIVPEAERPMIGAPRRWAPAMQQSSSICSEAGSRDVESAFAPRRSNFSSTSTPATPATGSAFRCRRVRRTMTFRARAVAWALIVIALLLVAAFAFARYLARPLRELDYAVDRVGRGETPPPLPESGPSEIASVNRGLQRDDRQPAPDRARPRGAAWPASRTTCARRWRDCVSASR